MYDMSIEHASSNFHSLDVLDWARSRVVRPVCTAPENQESTCRHDRINPIQPSLVLN